MHRVGKSETLASIARKYGTSARRLAELNNLNHRMTLVRGQRLKIEKEVVSSERPRFSSRHSRGARIGKGLKSHKDKSVKSHKDRKGGHSGSSRKRRR